MVELGGSWVGVDGNNDAVDDDDDSVERGRCHCHRHSHNKRRCKLGPGAAVVPSMGELIAILYQG